MSYFDSELTLLTPEEMGRADSLSIEAGTSEIELMGNAGRAVGQYIVEHYPRAPVSVLCGPGNNGGDGFVIGCYLRDRGWPVRLVQFGDKDRYSAASMYYLQQWGNPETYSPEIIEDASLLVDSLFGAGLDRPIAGAFADIVRLANETLAPTVAVDMPTGVHGATGQVLGTAIQADATITFFRKKPGHLLLPGRELCGNVALRQIGIEKQVLRLIEPQTIENHPKNWRLPTANVAGHKYSKGHCVVVSGPRGATGAARMSALSALRAGAGLVTINGERAALKEHASHLTAIMLRDEPLSELLNDERFNALVVGPGNGVSDATYHNVLTAIASNRALLLDADALNCFNSDPETIFNAIKKTNGNVVMTPHAGEFGRLFKNVELSAGKVEAARKAAEISGAVIVLKGADSVIASPDGRAAINSNAPPWLATAGSGDVLAGIIGGLQAQGMEAFDAACAGVYVHGLAAAQYGGEGMIATDLPQLVPSALAVAR
ncbi:NAD(P)H-hydrate dehydratase [Maritalea porphyrae]|uniref:Bifunctional NAD(P)H-hydrate repair enzyme n=1 Tax=Maritalea porphyrae TaxID=880732 RepID=A0ABQ5UVW3_9HYPH|nr:NAD(P)H-hydrate dehydratase [Maritalea porphyrae]GLQ18531.1 bifunctional NAD(P)H-hydrate repair enzyme [Maritalea porphyrae]